MAFYKGKSSSAPTIKVAKASSLSSRSASVRGRSSHADSSYACASCWPRQHGRRWRSSTLYMMLMAIVAYQFFIICRAMTLERHGDLQEAFKLDFAQEQHMGSATKNIRSTSTHDIRGDHASSTNTTGSTNRHHDEGTDEYSLPKNRVFVGIVSGTTSRDVWYRVRMRRLFSLWNTSSVLCSLPEFEENERTHAGSWDGNPCQVIYAFVFATNETYAAETMRLGLPSRHHAPDSSHTRFDSWQAAHDDMTVNPDTLKNIQDLNSAEDYVILKIVDNMDHGKSQTFLSYAASVVLEHYESIGYVMKLDLDSMIRLHALLHVLNYQMPSYFERAPSPQENVGRMFRRRPVSTSVGSLRNKAAWSRAYKNDSSIVQVKEGYWMENYDGLHMYLAGQCYVLSHDLVIAAVREAMRMDKATAALLAPDPSIRHEEQPHGSDPHSIDASATAAAAVTYLEGPEDHDVTALALQGVHPHAMRWIVLGKHTRFWEHPVKANARWKRIWQREVKRMERQTHKLAQPQLRTTSTETDRPPRFLIVITNSTVESRNRHRQHMLTQARSLKVAAANGSGSDICPYMVGARGDGDTIQKQCDVQWVFLLDQMDETEDPSPSDVLHITDVSRDDENKFGIEASIFALLGQIASPIALEQADASRHMTGIDYVVVCDAGNEINFAQLVALRDQHLRLTTTIPPPANDSAESIPSPSSSTYPNIVMGAVKEMLQEQARSLNVSLPSKDQEIPIHPFFLEFYNSVHLYVDDACYLISTRLARSIWDASHQPADQAASPVTEQQREQQQQKQDEQMEKERAEFHARSVGHGYRISTAAQMIPKVFPNVIALSKDDRFWSPVLNVKQ